MGGTSSKEDIVNEANDIVADVFSNLTLNCMANTGVTEAITITCTPNATTPNVAHENSTSCKSCYTRVKTIALSIYDGYRDAWENGTNSPSVPKAINDDFTSIINGMYSCIRRCKACNFDNISQSTSVVSNTKCQSTNNINNQVSQKMTTAIDQSLSNHSDVLGSLATFLGGKANKQDIVDNIHTRIMSKLTNNVVSSIMNAIEDNQTLNLSGSSVSINTVTQNSSYNSTVNFLQKNNIMDNIFTDAEYQEIQTLKSDTTTITKFGGFFIAQLGYISGLTKSIGGRIVIFAIAVAALVVVSTIIYVTTKLIIKKVKEDKLTSDVQRKQLMGKISTSKGSGSQILNF